MLIDHELEAGLDALLSKGDGLTEEDVVAFAKKIAPLVDPHKIIASGGGAAGFESEYPQDMVEAKSVYLTTTVNPRTQRTITVARANRHAHAGVVRSNVRVPAFATASVERDVSLEFIPTRGNPIGEIVVHSSSGKVSSKRTKNLVRVAISKGRFKIDGQPVSPNMKISKQHVDRRIVFKSAKGQIVEVSVGEEMEGLTIKNALRELA
ncbi:hypothetical protein ACXWTF_12680 [Thiomicrolovo sp. ZZH C-3]